MRLQNYTLTICSVLLFGMLLGCQPNSSTVDSQPGTNSQAPRHGLKLHKPKTLPLAVTRLFQINESLLSEDPFPAPLEIDYVEVIHGTGPGGHSHFYPASTYDAKGEHDDHHDDHSEEEESIKRLTAEIPLQTEVKDIVKWLPDLAAKSNASEADWTTVSDTSKSLTKIIAGIAKEASDADFRAAWSKQTKEIEALLAKLKTVSAKSTGEMK